MKESIHKNDDDPPLFLNAKMAAQVLAVSVSSGYELMHDRTFPHCGWAAAWWFPRSNSSNG